MAMTRASVSDTVRFRPGPARALAVRHPVLVFFSLAYLISWSWWVPLALRGEAVRTGVGWPTHLPGMAGPAVPAVLVTVIVDGRRGLHDLGRRVVRWQVSWAIWVLRRPDFDVRATSSFDS